MPNYRRWFVAGGSFFFTVVVERRQRLFDDGRAVDLLGSIFRACQARWPMTVNAIVLLPDHLHAIWTLPPGDAAYPRRWGWIKKEFTKQWLGVGQTVPDTNRGNSRAGICQAQPDLRAGNRQAQPDLRVSAARRRERRAGIWQPMYWEHTLESEDDFERHFDYIHWNPVKHGHVRCPHEWPHSSFHRYVKGGIYDRRWGCFATEPPDSFCFADIQHTTGE